MRRHWKLAAASVAVILVLVAGRACTPSGSESDRRAVRPTRTAANASRAPLGPTHVEHSVPQGWRAEAEGARAAVVSWIRLTGDIARAGFITRGDMIRALASEDFAPALVESTDQQVAEMLREFGDANVTPAQLVWMEMPLTARVVDASEMRARVEVWSVLVVAIPDVGVPRQAWRTVTVDVVWEHGDWKAASWRARSGPTPALAPHAAVATTAELVTVVGWPSVLSVGGD